MTRLFTLGRAAHASPIAMAGLVLANVVPLLGVILLGWNLLTIVSLYWLENGVVGVFAVGRILTAEGPASQTASAITFTPPVPVPATGSAPAAIRLALAGFFVMHYGFFWLIHGVFVWLALPLFLGVDGEPVVTADIGAVLLGGLALFASHGSSFVLNWLGSGERYTSNASAEMVAPYVRVVVLHLTILLGAFAVAFLGAPIWALVVMVVAKTTIDLSAHLAERKRAAGRMAAAPATPGATGMQGPTTTPRAPSAPGA